MDTREKFKQHLRATGRMERRRHRPIDWLGLAVFVSIAFMVSGFLSGEIESFVKEKNFLQEAVEFSTSRLEFRWNVNHNDSSPEKTYEELHQALLNNDLEGALATIHPAYLYKYEDNLRAAYQDGNLFTFTERLTSLQEKISEYGDGMVVSYAIEQIPNNNDPNPFNNYSREIEFIRNGSGVWKISSI